MPDKWRLSISLTGEEFLEMACIGKKKPTGKAAEAPVNDKPVPIEVRLNGDQPSRGNYPVNVAT